MLFVANKPRIFDMRMQNTYTPLDTVFVGAAGPISSMGENTIPHLQEIVSSKVSVGAIPEPKGAMQPVVHCTRATK
jgi:uncharacterized membrane protein (UPF0127 family)